jgi:hypothetical protein
MHLAEAIEAAVKDPLKGFRLDGEPGLYFIDGYWFERGWLAHSRGGEGGGWHSHIWSWVASRTDWKVVRLPARLRRYIAEWYKDPLSARRTRDHRKGKLV